MKFRQNIIIRTVIYLLKLIENKFSIPIYKNLSEIIYKKLAKKSLKKLGFEVVFRKKSLELIKKNKKIVLDNAHTVYLLGLANYFDHYFNSLNSTQQNNYKVLDFSKPKEHYFKKYRLSFYFSSLPEDDWEIKHYTYEYKPRNGDIIFDVGSYCGFSVYGFSELVGQSGKVYAFEPDGNNFKYLKKNILKHKLNNVHTIKKGLWSKTTILEFFEEGALGSSLKNMEYRSSLDKSTKIEVLSLTDAYTHLHLKKLDLIKMDIEGAELEVIKGSKEFIKSMPLHFAISCHDIWRHGKSEVSYIPLKKMFKELGYKTKLKMFSYKDFNSYMLYAFK